jgi:tetratricopeptide (TPR) repeat protein
MICGGLALLTLTTFAGVTDLGFVWDDEEYVTSNQAIANGVDGDAVLWAFTAGHSANWHPVTWLSHALDVELFGLEPAGHHRTSLLIHMHSAMLLFLVLRRMTGSVWSSAAVAAVFAVHPLRVESVAWVSERKDVLSVLFFLATLGAYAWYVRRRSVARLVVALVLFALGLMSKQMLVTLPFVLLLLDVWPLGRLPLPWLGGGGDQMEPDRGADARAPQSPWKVVAEKLPFMALAAAGAVVATVAQARGGAVGSFEAFPLASRLGNAVVSTVAYIGKLFWPRELAVIYPYRIDVPWWQVALAAAVLLAATIWAIRSLPTRPYVAVGWFWYLGTLVPVIGLVQVGEQAMADRYTYIPGIGLLILVCWLVPDLLRRFEIAPAALASAVAVVVAALAVLTDRQIEHWKSNEALFTHALEVTSGNTLAHVNLGMERVRQGRLEDAVPHFRAAVEIDPDHALAHNNLGMAALRQGVVDQAVVHLEKAVSGESGQAMYRVNLAMALAASGDLERAREQFGQARRLDPRGSHAEHELGTLMYRLGTTLLQQKQLKGCEVLLTGATRLQAELPGAFVGLGHASLAAGDVTAALGHYERAVALNPDPDQEVFGYGRSLPAQAHFGYGHTLAAVGEAAAAAVEYRAALELMPDMVDAASGLAWVLATSADDAVRDAQEAAGWASEACRLSGNRDPKALDALAAAHAAAGRFDRAVEVAGAAASAARAVGREALARAIEQRIAGYRERRPYREQAVNLAE